MADDFKNGILLAGSLFELINWKFSEFHCKFILLISYLFDFKYVFLYCLSLLQENKLVFLFEPGLFIIESF